MSIRDVDTQKTSEVFHFSTGPIDGTELHGKVYTSNAIVLQASPQLPADVFLCHWKTLECFAHAAVKRVKRSGNLQLARAEELLTHIEGLCESSDADRTVMMLLADTIVEIMLRETLKSAGVSGKDLRASVPHKIEAIEKLLGQVYLKEAILSLRDLRNSVAHQGQLPSQQQEHSALDTARQVMTHGCRE